MTSRRLESYAPRKDEGYLSRIALRFAAWAEKWFPDSYVFAALGVGVIGLAALLNGANLVSVSKSFGAGFWSLIPFTMQMVFVAIGGYVVATAPPVERLILRLAAVPTTGRGAVGLVATVSMLSSLLNWGLSFVLAGLLARYLARRKELAMDYRAAGAAAYLGLGATWALGLSSSAALLQANSASLPKGLLNITGVIPFSETIFLWQSAAMTVVIIVVSVVISMWSAPSVVNAVTADNLGVSIEPAGAASAKAQVPGEWLEHSPIVTIMIAGLGFGWLGLELANSSTAAVISNLNTYNFIFLMLGLLLHWRPKSFLNAVERAVPATAGVLIQFPLYGSIAAIMIGAKNGAGLSISDQLAHFFVSISNAELFPVVIGLYSAVLGMFMPSGGGKWIVEAPYVMEAAKALKIHLGWTVQVYNAAEALPNLINPFWMLPLLGILGLKARDVVGFTFLQLLIHLPIILFLLWAFALTLAYVPPVMPS